MLQSELRLDHSKKESSIWSALPRLVTDPRTLLAVMLLAVLVRLASALLQGDTVAPLPGIYDQLSYDGLAHRLLAGYGFSFGEDHWPATRAGEPTAHWSYLYTLYLAAVYALFEAGPLVARLIQAVLVGFLHTWLIWRVGRRSFGPTVAIVAAGLNAVYLYFVYYAGALITEPFYITAILWTLDVSLRLAGDDEAPTPSAHKARPEWWRWCELGLAIGVTVLLRQLFLLFVPFLYAWLWWVRNREPAPVSAPRPQRRMPCLRGMALATAVVVLLILPWTIRNYRAFGVATPLNTNAGFAFFWGNHPIYGTNFVGILPADGPSYQDLIPPALLTLNEAELDRALLKDGLQFVVDDPVRYLLLSLSRTREYFKFWPSPESGLASNLTRVASFGLLLPFMLHGLFLSLRTWPAQTWRRRAALALFYLFILVYTGIHLLTWTLIRYRLPVDALLILFAAYSMTYLAEKYGSTGSQGVDQVGLLVGELVNQPTNQQTDPDPLNSQ
jgi:hypothetical protein